jgi:hypothetical protein
MAWCLLSCQLPLLSMFIRSITMISAIQICKEIECLTSLTLALLRLCRNSVSQLIIIVVIKANFSTIINLPKTQQKPNPDPQSNPTTSISIYKINIPLNNNPHAPHPSSSALKTVHPPQPFFHQQHELTNPPILSHATKGVGKTTSSLVLSVSISFDAAYDAFRCT